MSNCHLVPSPSRRRAPIPTPVLGVVPLLGLASHAGHKVTFTVMGADYSTDPGVGAIFDSLTLK